MPRMVNQSLSSLSNTSNFNVKVHALGWVFGIAFKMLFEAPHVQVTSFGFQLHSWFHPSANVDLGKQS